MDLIASDIFVKAIFMLYILPIYIVHKGKKCDRTSQVKNMPAPTYNTRTVPNLFRTHFNMHIAGAEVR